MYRTNYIDVPSQEQLKQMIEHHQQQLPRFTRLRNYYLGQQDILNRQAKIEGNSNLKTVTNYCSLITNTLTSYFLSREVEYKSADLDKINQLNRLNNAADVDYEMSKLASIYGTAFELMYYDELGELKLAKCDPLSLLPVYSAESIEEKLVGALRYSALVIDKKTYYDFQYYNNETITYGRMNDSYKVISMETAPHYFNSIPVHELVNNNERMGDFEQIITLQDAYNLAVSDWGNNIDNVVNALLVFTNYNMEQSAETLEFIRKMKETGCISIDSDGDIKYIHSNLDTTSVQNLIETLKTDIHKISCCPDMGDDKFSGNASGVAMKYKLYNTEQLVGTKERKFSKFLYDRLRLISESPKGQGLNWLETTFLFNRNVPQNEAEIIESTGKLLGVVSHETAINYLGKTIGIENAEDELKKLEQEKQAVLGDY